MAVSGQRAHSVSTLRGQAGGQGWLGALGAVAGGAGFGKREGWSWEEHPALPASLHSCHACVTTTPLCLFELSFPISTNKSLCKDEQA